MILIAVLVSFGILWFGGKIQKPKYAAVYLSTGEIYFGKLSWFPSPRLSDVWLFQRTQEQGLSLDRFTNVVWQPLEPMRLSRDKIVFWTYLQPTSPVVQAIEGRILPAETPAPSPTP